MRRKTQSVLQSRYQAETPFDITVESPFYESNTLLLNAKEAAVKKPFASFLFLIVCRGGERDTTGALFGTFSSRVLLYVQYTLHRVSRGVPSGTIYKHGQPLYSSVVSACRVCIPLLSYVAPSRPSCTRSTPTPTENKILRYA